ncbi:spermidine synthase [Nocardioides jiangxiensis]|uniref:Fused MFS/spermidine synthase n=1 Tax=Nocardioides jiangxiensis TaxID=3064524 RepID=A0ABT9AXP0_9ACTN|nr:fused MFS/spermidine synthase [Nocardioides sp. WY-20]MDO7867053.1 fused MFS/spermidine synthase [Nocardioides sp. WY-20]
MAELFVLEMDGLQQSAVDPDDPTRLVFDYVRRIGDLIDAMPAGPLRVLHVGGAAMTLPRYVAATRRGSRQVVLEPDESVIARVERELPLPPRSGIEVRAEDGQTGVAGIRPGSQDLVILDAYDGGVVPEALTSAPWIRQVRGVLAPRGVCVANIVDRPPYPRIRPFVAAARDFGGLVVAVEPATLKGRREGNMLIACGAVPREAFPDDATEFRVFRGQAVADAFG